ncbi:MAG TPA: hypothetical protein VJ803_11190 [Gemmatimonadaceae bacterium]|jgi:hypothetical protein|nr:hypothetical protein [Gemmatimonadaceae bacterium]
MRIFTDESGNRWDVVLGKESFGTLVLLFSRRNGGDVRKSILASETVMDAEAELGTLSDDDLRARLRDAQPWE